MTYFVRSITTSQKRIFSTYALKPRFQKLLRPLVRYFARIGVTANQVTVATAFASIALGALMALSLPDTRAFLLVPLWMLLRMALNAIDGLLAREFAQQSRLGAYLNDLGDVVSDAALYAPFALLPPFSATWTAAVIALAIIAEYAGALGLSIGASRRCDGPMGKSDRVFVFGVLGLWAGSGAPIPEWIGFVMPLLVIALVFTIVNRVRGGLREVASER